ncbi:MAG: hypothetical protein BGO39_17765 [Chloroflexi bacterium 54-19]|nr:MAG: hypothetical protein BGO39_17765 [Chloroflexi bacterium 54-19]
MPRRGTLWVKKKGSYIFAKPQMKYKFIKEHLEEFGVSRMCNALQIAPSGYYKWCRQVQGQTLSPRDEADKVLGEQIEKVFCKFMQALWFTEGTCQPKSGWGALFPQAPSPPYGSQRLNSQA